jgi:AcrR family transcriptional regulator
MIKGNTTKHTIIETGLEVASRFGLECVTIGDLAKKIKMSKSGLFAHFQSKENLQIEILEYASKEFSNYVVIPALKTKRGIARIKKLVNRWIDWSYKLSGGCIFVTTSSEYSERPGKIRDVLLQQQESWIDCLRRVAISAIKSGDFSRDIDCDQFAYDLYSLLLGFHYYDRLLNDKKSKKRQNIALERLLDTYRPVSSIKHKSILQR